MDIKQALSRRTLIAFNVDNWLIFKSIVQVVEETNLPVIVQVSGGEEKFWGIETFFAIVDFQKKRGLPLFINLDHGGDVRLLKKAVDMGFDMVHIDASSRPWQTNIKLTRQVVGWARPKGILVEAEPQADMADPEKAREFYQKTKVDLLAVFVGNKHGFNPEKEEKIDNKLLGEVKEKAAPCLLTLHGGSGVNRQQLSRAIRGKLIQKININSRLRFIYRQSLVQSFKNNSSLRSYETAQPVIRDLKKEIKKIIKITL